LTPPDDKTKIMDNKERLRKYYVENSDDCEMIISTIGYLIDSGYFSEHAKISELRFKLDEASEESEGETDTKELAHQTKETEFDNYCKDNDIDGERVKFEMPRYEPRPLRDKPNNGIILPRF